MNGKTGWRKSSYSDSCGTCVEVNPNETQVAVRDSENPDGPVLQFPHGAWTQFVGSIRAGLFDR